MTKDEAQRHLKVINNIRTFYDAVKFDDLVKSHAAILTV
jgi:hypothetical protein